MKVLRIVESLQGDARAVFMDIVARRGRAKGRRNMGTPRDLLERIRRILNEKSDDYVGGSLAGMP
jgi:hypothetical protein